MSKEDRQLMLESAYTDWLMMINDSVPEINAREIIYNDYELTSQEKLLIESTMLRELERR